MDEEAEKLITEADNLVSAATQELEESDEPTQEDVVMYTENITKKIQELLLNAQAGRHSWYLILRLLFVHFYFTPCLLSLFTSIFTYNNNFIIEY